MSLYKSADLTLKIRRRPEDAFTVIAGIEASEIRLRSASVAVTRLGGSAVWHETSPASDVRSLQISGRGYFIGAGSDVEFKTSFLSGAHPECQISVPVLGVFQGPFALTELIYRMPENAEIEWRIKLNSAGTLQHTTN